MISNRTPKPFLRKKSDISPLPFSKQISAFTLIELLVVIAIIVLLVSILIPSLKKAKELALRAVCAGNLHNIGSAYTTYTVDNKSKIPDTGQIPWSPYYFKWGSSGSVEYQRLGRLYESKIVTDYTLFICPGRPSGFQNFITENVDPNNRSFVVSHYVTFVNPSESGEKYWTESLASMVGSTYKYDAANSEVVVSAATACYYPSSVGGNYEPGLTENLPHQDEGANVGFFDGGVSWLEKTEGWGPPWNQYDPNNQCNARDNYAFWMTANQMR